uniref:Uncharacterized protein n=1 Tax=Cacopsylla melanoneura TaxID=428564 RepID=A0A8D8X8U2_9HEMI
MLPQDRLIPQLLQFTIPCLGLRLGRHELAIPRLLNLALLLLMCSCRLSREPFLSVPLNGGGRGVPVVIVKPLSEALVMCEGRLKPVLMMVGRAPGDGQGGLSNGRFDQGREGLVARGWGEVGRRRFGRVVPLDDALSGGLIEHSCGGRISTTR